MTIGLKIPQPIDVSADKWKIFCVKHDLKAEVKEIEKKEIEKKEEVINGEFIIPPMQIKVRLLF